MNDECGKIGKGSAVVSFMISALPQQCTGARLRNVSVGTAGVRSENQTQCLLNVYRVT